MRLEISLLNLEVEVFLMRAAMAAEARSFLRRREYLKNTREVSMGMIMCRVCAAFVVMSFSVADGFEVLSFCLFDGGVKGELEEVLDAGVLSEEERSGGGMKFFVVFSRSTSSETSSIFRYFIKK